MKPTHHFSLVILNIPFLLLNPAVQAQDAEPAGIDLVEIEKTEEEKAKSLLAKKVAEGEKEAAKLAKETARKAEAAKKKAERSAEKFAREKANRNEKTAKEAAELELKAAEHEREAVKRAEAAEKKQELSGLNPDTDKKEAIELPVTEPERLAEVKVSDVTREVTREFDKRKTRIEGQKEAKQMINEILGAESRISKAEIVREERFRQRFERQRQEDPRMTKASSDQRRAATTYYQERLRGREVEGPPPEFFRQSQEYPNRKSPRVEQRIVERVESVRPRYMNEGRRYVHYDSRSSIPAILMAALAMNQVQFQPTREIAPIFYDRRDDSPQYAMPLPPENYRGENSWVVSYPVDEKSMISSEDILFLQGTTQFADPYSYEVIGVMADAMKAMPEQERFVIEGHASAEGSYENNMALSQLRAEYIVREIVRRGVSPYRLLPVGYGESEARRPENATESLRSQDRRVVVFRMKAETIAQR